MLVALLSLMGLGSTMLATNQTMYGTGYSNYDYWYDVNGHVVMFKNGTAYDEAGFMHVPSVGSTHPQWDNYSNVYDMYDNPYGEDRSWVQIDFDISSSYGLIALIVGMMALVAVIGIKVFGTGEGEVSTMTILKGTAFLTLWGIFSAISLTLITQIPMSLGAILYFILTAMYCVGIIQSIGSGGTD